MILEACSAAAYDECKIECRRSQIYKDPEWFGPWIPGDYKSKYCKDYKPPIDKTKPKKQLYETGSLFN